MGLAIVFRHQANINKFRDIMIGAIASGVGDRAIMTSGFFQENATFFGRVNAYQATNEPGLIPALVNNNVHLITLGVHAAGRRNNLWINSYVNFVNNLIAAGVTLTPRLHPNLRWHAKYFRLDSQGDPVLFIVGSSNITRPAFSDTAPFNNECDVIIWDDAYPGLGAMVQQHFNQADDQGYGMIIGAYDPNNNKGLTLNDRLQWFAEQINLDETVPLQLV